MFVDDNIPPLSQHFTFKIWRGQFWFSVQLRKGNKQSSLPDFISQQGRGFLQCSINMEVFMPSHTHTHCLSLPLRSVDAVDRLRVTRKHFGGWRASLRTSTLITAHTHTHTDTHTFTMIFDETLISQQTDSRMTQDMSWLHVHSSRNACVFALGPYLGLSVFMCKGGRDRWRERWDEQEVRRHEQEGRQCEPDETVMLTSIWSFIRQLCHGPTAGISHWGDNFSRQPAEGVCCCSEHQQEVGNCWACHTLN